MEQHQQAYPPFYNGQLDGIPSSNPLGKPIQSYSPEKSSRTDKSQTGQPEPVPLRDSHGSISPPKQSYSSSIEQQQHVIRPIDINTLKTQPLPETQTYTPAPLRPLEDLLSGLDPTLINEIRSKVNRPTDSTSNSQIKTDIHSNYSSTASRPEDKISTAYSSANHHQSTTPDSDLKMYYTSTTTITAEIINGRNSGLHERAHNPHIDIGSYVNENNKSSFKTGIEDGCTTPVTGNTMHEKEVLKTPKKHERILENEWEESPEKTGSFKKSQQIRKTYAEPDSFLSPERRTIRTSSVTADGFPDRTHLISSINNALQKSAGRERLLSTPSRVSIIRQSALSPAKIEVERLFKEKYEDGSIYEGNAKDGIRHGKGRIYYADGMIFEGRFDEGVMYGPGVLWYKNGKLCFEGDYKDDKFEGHGILYNGLIGGMNSGFDYQDFGKTGNCWVKYEGDFVQDKKNGTGTLYLQNGERYFGEFKDDKVHGKGTFYLIDGTNITGYWENNQLKFTL